MEPMIAQANHTVQANGIRQNYIDAGAGAPVVLLHGFPETNFAWRHQIPVLGELYRIIAPDLRGCGETDKPASGYDKRTMANDLAALLDTLGIQKVALVGHDRGARVATRFAKDFPDRVERLVVMDNVPIHSSAFALTERYGKDTFIAIRHLGAKRLPGLFALKGRFDALVARIPLAPRACR